MPAQQMIQDDSAPPLDPFRDGVLADATELLTELLGTAQGAKAAASVAMAFVALAKTSPKMRQCTPESVRNCIAMVAMTGLMPGGGLPGAYVLPRDRWTKVKGRFEQITELNFQIGFRGLLTLAYRAGYQISAYPVYEGAPVELDARDRLIIPTTRRRVKREWDLLIGVIVTVHRLDDGHSLGRFFVETDLIEARRDASDSWIKGNETVHKWGENKGQEKSADEIARDRRSPWFEWPEEMAMKTALIYVVRRGYVPVDDVSEHVLRADAEGDRIVIDTTATEAAVPGRISGKQGLLDDKGSTGVDYRAEQERIAAREKVRTDGEAPQPGSTGSTPAAAELSAADRFRANVKSKLNLDVDGVEAWLAKDGIDLDKLDEAGIKTLWTAIQPRGGKRNALNAFLTKPAPTTTTSAPPKGDGEEEEESP